MSLEEKSDLEASPLLCSEDEEDEDLVMQDKLLEELLRLRLSESHSGAAAAASLLPPKQRVKLFQPRSKFEQFKDILQESRQLIDDPSAKNEEEDLRSSWLNLKDSISGIYSRILGGSLSEVMPQAQLGALQETVAQLAWKDPHQLFVRLEAGIREFVIDLKLILIELLQKQAKNPSLAQDFIQSLLDGYEKICNAAAYVSPALQELEMGHLRLFGLTWEVMNKHLYQSIIYTDPLIQNNLPIFISQLRSLYPDKEHEARYTELVRSYLDFDVEMEKIGAFWKISEPLIANYNKEQVLLMEKQKMLREDWEKFKLQRKAIDKQLKEEGSEEVERSSDATSQSDDKSEESLSLVSESFSHLLSGIEDLGVDGIPPEIEKDLRRMLRLESQSLFPLPFQGGGSEENNEEAAPFGCLSTEECNSMAQLLQYGLLFHEDTSDDDDVIEFEKDPSPKAEESPQTPAHDENTEGSKDNEECECHACTSLASISQTLSKCAIADSSSGGPPCPSPVPSSASNHLDLYPHIHGSSELSSTTLTITTTTTTSSSSSNSEPPAATKEASLNGGDDDEECDEKALTSTTPSSSSAQSPLVSAKNNANNSNHNVTSSSSKRKVCSANHAGGNNSREINKLLQQHYCGHKKAGTPRNKSGGEGGEVSEDEDTCSSASADSKHCSCCYCEVFGHGGPSVAPVSRNYPEMRERLRLLLNKKKKKCKQQQPGVTAPPAVPPPPPRGANPISTSASASKIPSSLVTTNSSSSVSKSASLSDLKTKDVEEILEYIEGGGGKGSSAGNEKKRAKKDRQKQQRLEEQRRRDEAERRRKEAEDAERRRLEEEIRREEERAHQLLKKRNKKEKQKAKKAAAKGINPSEPDTLQQDAALKLEELKAQHLREVEQLKLIQQQQLEETQRTLLLQHQRTTTTHNNHSSFKAAAAAANPPPSSSSAPPSKSSGKQVRITRTPNGGVEFSTVEDPKPRLSPSSPPALSTSSMAFANSGMMFKPSIPSSKPSSNQPMVTIKRVHTGDGESTVTISTKSEASSPTSAGASSSSSSQQLLYTLINGQVHKSQHAPPNLIPGVVKNLSASNSEALSKKQRKKLRKQFKSTEELRGASPPMTTTNTTPTTNSGLPTTPEGKLDLDNLNLPPGISITRIEGPVPERKYYPSKAPANTPLEQPPPPPAASVLPPIFPGGLLPNGGGNTPVGYSAMAGMPSSLNGPNVIVVDTSTLSTEEEKNTKKAKKKNKKTTPSQQPAPPPPSSSSSNRSPFPGFLQPEIPSGPKQQDSSSGSSSSGPQVLIKNVNGQVVITPVPGTGATAESIPAKLNGGNNNKKSKSSSSGKGGKENQAKVVLMKNNANLSSSNSVTTNNATPNGRHHPLSSSSEELPNGHASNDPPSQKKKSKKPKKKNSIGENIDEINSIFAPKDIDLENGEIDDDEREIEAFKRFCFNSVPLQQKTKVNFDVKNIAFKKK